MQAKDKPKTLKYLYMKYPLKAFMDITFNFEEIIFDFLSTFKTLEHKIK